MIIKNLKKYRSGLPLPIIGKLFPFGKTNIQLIIECDNEEIEDIQNKIMILFTREQNKHIEKKT